MERTQTLRRDPPLTGSLLLLCVFAISCPFLAVLSRPRPKHSFIPVEATRYRDFPGAVAGRNQAYTSWTQTLRIRERSRSWNFNPTCRLLIKGNRGRYCCGKHSGPLPMSLDLEPCLPSIVDSPKRQLKPLILVERVKQLQIRHGGGAAVCDPYQQEAFITPSNAPQGVDFPRKVIINKPRSLFRAKSEDVRIFTIPEKNLP